MTRVVVEDERMLAALRGIGQRAELCDASGNVFGYYVRKNSGDVFYRGIESPLSSEERERLLREEGPTARPLSEFWDDMKKKYPDAYHEDVWDEMKQKYSDERK